jgi:hypothetical protein
VSHRSACEYLGYVAHRCFNVAHFPVVKKVEAVRRIGLASSTLPSIAEPARNKQNPEDLWVLG